MAEKDIGQTEENPNIEEREERHEEDEKRGGVPGGNHEGSDTGSRGDHKRAGSGNTDYGSRTSKKN